MTSPLQDVNLVLTYAHRRSCSILHRDPDPSEANTETAAGAKRLLDSQVPAAVLYCTVLYCVLQGPPASHDFDAIPHSGCSYDTSGSLNINVDTILGGGKEEAMTEEEYKDVYGDYNPDAEVIAQEEVRCL